MYDARQFLILGCQRTGNTLLKLILESHPYIYCYGETVSYAMLEERNIPQPKLLTGFQAPHLTPFVDYISELFKPEECKIIFVQREAKDVLASMNNLITASDNEIKPYLTKYFAPFTQDKIDNDPGFCKVMYKELGVLDKCAPGSDKANFVLAAIYYKWLNTRILELYRAQGWQVHVVQYESLILNRIPTLQSLCKFLGVAFSESMLHHERAKHYDLVDTNIAPGHTITTLPVYTTSIGLYKHELAPAVIDLIDEVMSA